MDMDAASTSMLSHDTEEESVSSNDESDQEDSSTPAPAGSSEPLAPTPTTADAPTSAPDNMGETAIAAVTARIREGSAPAQCPLDVATMPPTTGLEQVNLSQNDVSRNSFDDTHTITANNVPAYNTQAPPTSAQSYLSGDSYHNAPRFKPTVQDLTAYLRLTGVADEDVPFILSMFHTSVKVQSAEGVTTEERGRRAVPLYRCTCSLALPALLKASHFCI